MKKTFSHLLLGVAFMLGAGVTAGPAFAETLYDAVQSAITTHPSVSAAEAAKDASGQTIREQRSAYFPELSGNLTAGRIYGDNATSRGLSVTRGAGYSNLGEGSASLTQRIFDWGETGDKVDAAKARAKAADSTITGTQETIALRAAQSYIALLRATRLKEAGAKNLANIQEYQKKIADQLAAGGSDEAELNRANDFLLLAQNAATEFDGQYQQALADYVEATGDKPHSGLHRPALPSNFPTSVDKAIDSAFAAHPQIQAAQAAVTAADHDIDAEGTTYLPKLSSQLSYLKRDQADVIGGEAIDARALMKMDWNYSTGGAQFARKDRAAFLKAQAKAQLDETYRRIEHDVRVSWSALDVVRQQQKTQEDRKAATAKVIDTYKTQYEGGNRKLVELMQAESQAFDASVAYDNADFGVVNATYTLLAATGQLVGSLQPQAVDKTQAADEKILSKPDVVASIEPAKVEDKPVPAPAPVITTADQLAVPPREAAIAVAKEAAAQPAPALAPVTIAKAAITHSDVSSVSRPVLAEDVLMVPSTDYTEDEHGPAATH